MLEVGLQPEAQGFQMCQVLCFCRPWDLGSCIFSVCMVSLSLLLLPFSSPSFFPFFTASQGPTSFHVIQISSFANSTWTQNQGSGWLDDMQIHDWDSDTGTAIFLKPWAKGNFSDEAIVMLEEIFRVYFFVFTSEVQDHVSEFQLECKSSPQT